MRICRKELEKQKLKESLLDKKVKLKKVKLENRKLRAMEVCSFEKLDESSKVNESLVDKLQTEGYSLSQEE
ncbi:unnamed protein product [Arabidopsis lyrata]|nr:unnamed protein product [Arabidopsis lyrata]